ncbi:hypothetical protein ABG067_000850 [Albugo candida]|uniref:Cleavage stimulation factor subunit 2 hinge domain-containing protein n=1 Tax=Albugo candida TaxID=65357 RepID=A0A024GUN6_9STRA|nr:unnamed protein product [Albugo candida]|eukprot:CCI50322.1 unnamed protein product [Albugo candida]
MSPAIRSISEYSDEELYELLYYLKQCNESAPEEMRLLLQEQPEFTRAIAQAQLRLGQVKPPPVPLGAQSDVSASQKEAHTSKKNSQKNACASKDDTKSFLQELDPEQQQLLEEIQNLAPEVIQSLPAQERHQIMELREAMGLPPV